MVAAMALEATLVVVAVVAMGVVVVEGVVAWDPGTDLVTGVVMAPVTVLVVKAVGEVVEEAAAVDPATMVVATGPGMEKAMDQVVA
jgi:hypothetical protein